MLKRKIYSKIEEHLKSGSKRMLIVDGTRQIGKSYIIRKVVSNERQTFCEEGITYMPVYNIMFLESDCNYSQSELFF